LSKLKCEGLTKNFGGLVAVNNVTFSVSEREILGLIGPNGAGKTTLFNCLTGFLKPDRGKILFKDLDITNLSHYKIANCGIARTFQLTRVFNDLTVLENVMVGSLLHYPRVKEAREHALEILEFTDLYPKSNYLGKSLTVADRKRLEIARTLATEPTLIMLDEAMSGLNPKETEQAIELCNKLNEKGLTIILVEHVMEVIMPLSHRIMVLNNGSLIAKGKPEEIANNPKVIKAYLGEKWNAKS